MTEDYTPEKTHPASRLPDHGEESARWAEASIAAVEEIHLKERKSEDRHILQYFQYAHLAPHLQEIGKAYYKLAILTANRVPDSPETTVALRKLLEAREAAVRAAFF